MFLVLTLIFLFGSLGVAYADLIAEAISPKSYATEWRTVPQVQGKELRKLIAAWDSGDYQNGIYIEFYVKDSFGLSSYISYRWNNRGVLGPPRSGIEITGLSNSDNTVWYHVSTWTKYRVRINGSYASNPGIVSKFRITGEVFGTSADQNLETIVPGGLGSSSTGGPGGTGSGTSSTTGYDAKDSNGYLYPQTATNYWGLTDGSGKWRTVNGQVYAMDVYWQEMQNNNTAAIEWVSKDGNTYQTPFNPYWKNSNFNGIEHLTNLTKNGVSVPMTDMLKYRYIGFNSPAVGYTDKEYYIDGSFADWRKLGVDPEGGYIGSGTDGSIPGETGAGTNYPGWLSGNSLTTIPDMKYGPYVPPVYVAPPAAPVVPEPVTAIEVEPPVALGGDPGIFDRDWLFQDDNGNNILPGLPGLKDLPLLGELPLVPEGVGQVEIPLAPDGAGQADASLLPDGVGQGETPLIPDTVGQGDASLMPDGVGQSEAPLTPNGVGQGEAPLVPDAVYNLSNDTPLVPDAPLTPGVYP